MAKYEDNGNSASDNYDVKQLPGGSNPDAAPALRGNHGVQSTADGMVQAREFAEDEKIKEIHRKISAIMEEDEPPRHAPQGHNTGHVRRKNPGGLTLNDLAAVGGGLNDAVSGVGMDLFHEGYKGGNNEAAQMAESMAGRPQAEPAWDWKAVKSMATLRGGKKVPVWMVENTITGMQINKPFRIQAPAERIVSVLNVTGNANDPRVRQITEDYDEYVSLSKQLRKAKQLHESGNPDGRKTGERVVMKLRGVKQRLGI